MAVEYMDDRLDEIKGAVREVTEDKNSIFFKATEVAERLGSDMCARETGKALSRIEEKSGDVEEWSMSRHTATWKSNMDVE